jgi:hypothetical protein
LIGRPSAAENRLLVAKLSFAKFGRHSVYGSLPVPRLMFRFGATSARFSWLGDRHA